MLNKLKIRIYRMSDSIKRNGLKKTFSDRIFLNKIMIPTVMDLDNYTNQHSLNNSGYEIAELTEAEASNNKLEYSNELRSLLATQNTKIGRKSFLLVNNNRVVGDIWYVCPEKKDIPVTHPDFSWLRIKPEKNSIYAFDMYIDPLERGKNLAVSFMGTFLNSIKDKGFSKAYGHYGADNIPALWVHRSLKWTELDKVSVSSFLMFKTASKIAK